MLRLTVAAVLAALFLNSGADTRTVMSAESPAAILESTDSHLAMTLVRRRGDLIEVTATHTPTGGTARTITLRLDDGEGTALAFPGRPETRFHDRRDGDRVETRVEE